MIKLNQKLSQKLSVIFFFLLLILILSPNLVWLMTSTSLNKPILSGLFPALIGVAFVLSLFKRIWVGALFLSFISVFSIWESWYILKFGSPSGLNLLAIISESNSIEVFDFINGIENIVIITFLFPLLLSIVTIYLLNKNNFTWGSRYRKLFFYSSFFGLVLIFSLLVINELNIDNEFEYNNYVFNQKIDNEVSFEYKNSWPIGIPFRIWMLWSHHRYFHKIKNEIEKFKFGSSKKAMESKAQDHKSNFGLDQETIVLVIGETSRPDHWQLFGYNKSTNPHLLTIKNLILYKDVITAWDNTRMSVPLMITRKSEKDRALFFPEKSVISAFKEAGYYTAWLSNQSAIGFYENTISFYANEADSVRFFNPTSFNSNGAFDEVLLSGLRKEQNLASKFKFIVIHTMGSHFNYTHRYPDTFNFFQPSKPIPDNLSLHDKNQKEYLINTYDNSILYTDFILSEIINILKNKNDSSLMIYLSDHGENLYDNNCDLSGHSHHTQYDYKVPMLLWYSDQYKKLHSNQITNAKQNALKPVSTASIFQSLLNSALISIPNEDLRKSIFSEEFLVQPRWIVSDEIIDYDKSKSGEKCKLQKK